MSGHKPWNQISHKSDKSHNSKIKRKRKLDPHWYMIVIYECPVCGRGSVYRERRFDEKPLDPADRHEYVPMYDWCQE